MIVHRDLKPENLLLSADKKHLVISDFGLSTGMQGSRNLLKTRCGTVHYISPEVAKGDPYVGMASDIWSVGIILYAMVTASLPFDGPNSVAVLKRIVRGEFTIPAHVPKELQDLIRLMLTLDPKERITIQQIKQHPWYLGIDDTPRQNTDDTVEEPYVLTLKEVQQHSEVLSNLRLLGWEESELMNELLDTKMNMAKAFYKLLIEHKNHPNDETDTPRNIDKRVLRRRSIGAPTRAAKIGVTSDTTKPSQLKSSKRSSQRSNNRSQLPINRSPNNSNDEASLKQRTGGNTVTTATKPDPSTSPKKSSNQNLPESKKTTVQNSSEANQYQLVSNKSVAEILEALKGCFADLGQYEVSAKQTKNGLKVKARKSGKRHGSPVVTVNLMQGEDTKIAIKGGRGKLKSKEELKEITKKVEQTLVV